MPAKLKPTRADRKLLVSKAVEKSPKKKRGHWHAICPQCGEISHSKQDIRHSESCQRQLIMLAVRKRQTDRQLVNMALDCLCRLITVWRDGCNCVLSEIDGAKCSNDSQWGHVVPQGSCSYLVHNLSNSFRQCSTHNGIHRFVQLTYHLWYQRTFGKLALVMLEAKRLDNPRADFSISDLLEKLHNLNTMYENRFSYSTASMGEKIAAGFYGDIIREAWVKEGRI